MNIRVFLITMAMLATASAYTAPANESKTIKIGEQISVSFDQGATTGVSWYFLEPTGPGIELVKVETTTKPTFAQSAPMVGGGLNTRTFTFKATKTTGLTFFALRFIKMDFSYKVYEGKTISYQVIE